MHFKKIISLIVSSAMMASILTVPKADSKTDIHLQKSDIVFAADSEMPATSTSTTTTITTTTTTPKKTTSSNFTTTTTTKQITTTTSSTPDKVINGTEVDRFDSIKTMPTKTIYAEGEELDLSGLVVKVWHWLGGLREESIFEIESIDSKYIIISDLEGKTYKAEDFPKLKGGTAYTVSFANGKEIFINVKAKGDSDEREIYNLPYFFFRVYIDSSDNDSKFLRIDNAEVEKFEYDTENGVKLKDIGSFTIDKDASMKKDHIIPDDIKKGDILSGVMCLDPTGKSIYYGDLEIQKFDEYYDDPFAVFTHIPSNTEKNWTLDKDGLLTISGPGPYNYSPKEVKNILIQDNVTVIEDRAFAGCNSVESVTIPDSVKYIGAKAFYECSSLESIAIPDSIISIGDSAFSYCSKLKSITLPKSLISIGHGAFSQCSRLESLTIPDSVTQIGASVCGQNRSLSSVTLPSSIKRLNRGIFYGCVSLESITIPDLVTSIGDYAFDSCRNLKSIIIPDSVTSIGDKVFCGCTSLESITIPNSVTSIGEKVFYECTNLKSITLPDALKTHKFEKVVNYPSKYIYKSGETLDINGLLINFVGVFEELDYQFFDAKDFCVIDKDGNKISGDKLDTLPAGYYTVNYENAAMQVSYNADFVVEDVEFSYKIHIIGNYDESVLWGDANLDGIVDMGDAVIIMQSLANPQKYGVNGTDEKHITAEGQLLGDVDINSIGITSYDALKIQNFLLDKIFSLDPSLEETKIYVTTSTAIQTATTSTTTTTTTTTIFTSSPYGTEMGVSCNKIYSYPTKTVYNIGEELEIDGLKVASENNSNLSLSQYEFSTKNCTIVDENGKKTSADKFNTLSPGKYIVNYQDYYFYGVNGAGIHYWINVSFEVTIEEATENEIKEREKNKL